MQQKEIPIYKTEEKGFPQKNKNRFYFVFPDTIKPISVQLTTFGGA